MYINYFNNGGYKMMTIEIENAYTMGKAAHARGVQKAPFLDDSFNSRIKRLSSDAGLDFEVSIKLMRAWRDGWLDNQDDTLSTYDALKEEISEKVKIIKTREVPIRVEIVGSGQYLTIGFEYCVLARYKNKRVYGRGVNPKLARGSAVCKFIEMELNDD